MNYKDSLVEEKITNRFYILGRKKGRTQDAMNIGRYYALDGSLGSQVNIDMLYPHIIVICGKRGYGKSYTIGVLLEEIACLKPTLREKLAIIVFDTLGIFWTMQHPNTQEAEVLKQWQCTPQGFPIRLFVPEEYVKDYLKKGIVAERFSIRVAEVSPFHWCHLFDIKPTDPLGIVLTRAVLHMQACHSDFSLDELLSYIRTDENCRASLIQAAENIFSIAKSWGIFNKKGISIYDFAKPGALTILDMSYLPHPSLKTIVAALLGEKIFVERVRARKTYEQKKMGFSVEETGLPMVWLAIDEAQLFLPQHASVASKDVFINEWMRQGRHPGLSLILATQRPSALDSEVFSHSDIIMCHRLTAQQDIDALSHIRPTYMQDSIKEALKKLGDEKGVAFIIDDTSETSHLIKIRPRSSWHGGSEPCVVDTL
jgi:hypothetical protein